LLPAQLINELFVIKLNWLGKRIAFRKSAESAEESLSKLDFALNILVFGFFPTMVLELIFFTLAVAIKPIMTSMFTVDSFHCG